MSRTQFAHSRALITYADGMEAATCSLHCLALDLAINRKKPFRKIQVGDYRTRDLIDAETACWVLGGSKPGVMTRRAKWAFADKKSAQDFIREDSGELGDFTSALKATYEDMYDDLNMLRKKQPTPR